MDTDFRLELEYLYFDPNIKEGLNRYDQLAKELETYKLHGLDQKDPVLYQHFSNLLGRMESILGAWRSQFKLDKRYYPWTYQKDEPDSELNEKTKTAYSEVKGEWGSAARIYKDGGDKFKMVKGYTGGGKGIDQIWVSKDWNDVNTCPDNILVVESKFGSSKVEGKKKVYRGAIGLDGQPLEDGCSQMMPDWVYVNARTMQSTSEGAFRRKDPIDFGGGAQTLEHTRLYPLTSSTKVGQCLANSIHPQLSGQSKKIQAVEVRVNDDGDTELVDHTPNWAHAYHDLTDVYASMQAVGSHSATNFVVQVCANDPQDPVVKARKKILGGKDVTAQKHLLNIQKRRETLERRKAALNADIEGYNVDPFEMEDEQDVDEDVFMPIDEWETFLDMVRAYSPQQFVNMAAGRVDDEENLDLPTFAEHSEKWRRYSEQQLQEIKRLMLKRDAMANDVAEMNGEEAAAFFMSDEGYAMAKGFTEPGPGIDQIWYKPIDWNPGSKTPPDEIVIVEAKGSPNANVSRWDAYVGSPGKDGKPMLQGCKQMTPEWVWHHANTMTKEAEVGTNPIGGYIKQGLENGKGPPKLLGVVLKQENMTSTIDNTNYQFLGNVPRTEQGTLVYN